MCRDKPKRLNLLKAENIRLRRAVSDLTLGKLNLTEAAGGNSRSLYVAAGALSTDERFCALSSSELATH